VAGHQRVKSRRRATQHEPYVRRGQNHAFGFAGSARGVNDGHGIGLAELRTIQTIRTGSFDAGEDLIKQTMWRGLRADSPAFLDAVAQDGVAGEMAVLVVHGLEAVDVDGKNAASIRSGQSFFKILGLPEEEFPPLPKFEEAKVVTIRQKDLRDGLRKTSYAISTDETRYVLNGVLFSFKDNKLTLVATDGRRLAMVDIELEIPRSQETDIIVPTKAVTELGRLLTDDGDVKISVSSGQIAFDLNKTLLVSKLIEGNYPNYKQVIPGDAKERVTLERETFLNSLRRVSLLASDKSNSIKLNFSKKISWALVRCRERIKLQIHGAVRVNAPPPACPMGAHPLRNLLAPLR